MTCDSDPQKWAPVCGPVSRPYDNGPLQICKVSTVSGPETIHRVTWCVGASSSSQIDHIKAEPLRSVCFFLAARPSDNGGQCRTRADGLYSRGVPFELCSFGVFTWMYDWENSSEYSLTKWAKDSLNSSMKLSVFPIGIEVQNERRLKFPTVYFLVCMQTALRSWPIRCKGNKLSLNNCEVMSAPLSSPHPGLYVSAHNKYIDFLMSHLSITSNIVKTEYKNVPSTSLLTGCVNETIK